MRMKRMTSISIVLAVGILLPSVASAQLSVDNPGKRVISFSGDFVFLSDAPVETIKGTAPGASGIITTDTTDLVKTTGTISVPVKDMKTGNSTRDRHLRSKDWLDARKHPEITFEIENVRVVSFDNDAEIKFAQLEASGSFSLHGVTKNLTIPLILKWKGDKAKVTAEFQVHLADFDVKGKEGVVGDRVGTVIQLTANLNGQVQAVR